MDFPMYPWLSRVGRDRWPNGFPVRALRDAGVPQAFASDWPVSDINPMRGVKAALTRTPWSDWPGTRYEAKALREGRKPHYLTFRRL